MIFAAKLKIFNSAIYWNKERQKGIENVIKIDKALLVQIKESLSKRHEVSLKKLSIKIKYPRLLASYCANKKMFVIMLYCGPQCRAVNWSMFFGGLSS
jgi:hypothetical protein